MECGTETGGDFSGGNIPKNPIINIQSPAGHVVREPQSQSSGERAGTEITIMLTLSGDYTAVF